VPSRAPVILGVPRGTPPTAPFMRFINPIHPPSAPAPCPRPFATDIRLYLRLKQGPTHRARQFPPPGGPHIVLQNLPVLMQNGPQGHTILAHLENLTPTCFHHTSGPISIFSALPRIPSSPSRYPFSNTSNC